MSLYIGSEYRKNRRSFYPKGWGRNRNFQTAVAVDGCQIVLPGIPFEEAITTAALANKISAFITKNRSHILVSDMNEVLNEVLPAMQKRFSPDYCVITKEGLLWFDPEAKPKKEKTMNTQTKIDTYQEDRTLTNRELVKKYVPQIVKGIPSEKALTNSQIRAKLDPEFERSASGLNGALCNLARVFNGAEKRPYIPEGGDVQYEVWHWFDASLPKPVPEVTPVTTGLPETPDLIDKILIALHKEIRKQISEAGNTGELEEAQVDIATLNTKVERLTSELYSYKKLVEDKSSLLRAQDVEIAQLKTFIKTNL